MHTLVGCVPGWKGWIEMIFSNGVYDEGLLFFADGILRCRGGKAGASDRAVWVQLN